MEIQQLIKAWLGLVGTGNVRPVVKDVISSN